MANTWSFGFTRQTMREKNILFAGKATRPHRILVVDDDREIRRINSSALMHSGYYVESAEDGAVAWEALQCRRHDLLVTDNQMPHVSGVELLKKMYTAHHSLPVIMVTAAAPDHEFQKNPWLRPSATLLKPYTIDDLLNTVREVLCAAFGSHETITFVRSFEPASDEVGKIVE